MATCLRWEKDVVVVEDGEGETLRLMEAEEELNQPPSLAFDDLELMILYRLLLYCQGNI